MTSFPNDTDDPDIPEGPETQERPRILIIEDDPLNRSFLEAQIRGLGYEILTAEDGAVALEILNNQEPVDLILLDLFLPRVSGEEVLHAIRSDSINNSIPVIVITAADDAERRARVLRSGANDFIRKPFDVEELTARITAHLAARQTVQLASLLEVAGAIAHEINQPLTGLIGYAEMIRMHAASDAKIAKWVGNICMCAERISKTVKRLVALQKYTTIHYHGRRHILRMDADADDGE